MSAKIMLMDTVILFALLLSNVALLAVALGALFRARQMVSRIEDTIHTFFDATDEKTPSPFAQLVDSAAAVLTARLITSAQAALRGSEGGTQKGINSEERAAMVAANPLLGLMGGKLGKNPLAVAIVSKLGERLLGTGTVGPGGNHSTPTSGDSPHFKL